MDGRPGAGAGSESETQVPEPMWNTKIISDLLGHSSTSFTTDVYSHAIPRMEEAAVESFAALVMS